MAGGSTGRSVKPDIELVFGVLGGGRINGESGTLIQGQLASLMTSLNNATNSKNRRIIINLDVAGTKSNFSTQIKNILSGLNGQKQFAIKVNKIDVSSAVANVKKDLQNMLSALSVENGVNITGLKDFIGTDGIDEALKKTASGADEAINRLNQARQSAAEFAGEAKTLDKVGAALDKTFGSALSGNKKIADTAAIKEITAAYNEWNRAVSVYRQTNQGDSAALMSQGLDIERRISALQDEEAAAKRANTQLNALKTTYQALSAAYKSATHGSGMIADQAQLDAIIAKYREWVAIYDQVLAGSKSFASTDEYNAFMKEGNELQRQITLEQSMQRELAKSAAAAEAAAAAEEKRRQKQEASTATLREISNLYKQVNTYMEKNTRIRSTSQYQDLRVLQERLLEIVHSGKEISATDFTAFRNQFSALTTGIRAAGKEGRSFGDIVTGAFQKFGGWSIVTRSMMMLRRQFIRMLTTIKEVDTAMTELRKVTDETDSTYARFLDNAAERAKAIGASLTDTINASADFARLGYELEDAAAIADAALIYKNVGDGIEDISDASESVISTMKAFGIEAKDVMTIVDRFNNVGNNFAISSGGVGDALMRSASALAAANNTIDESIALVTTANTVIQDPEKVGTAMKTLSMYLRAAKTELEDAGEDTDGMASSVSELREELLSLTGGRVDIQIDEDTFKSTYQIVRELSEVWGDLADVTRANILEMVGGKRNSNVVAALLSNFDIAEQVINTSANSAGSAIEENEKVLDSVQGKLNVLTATAQEFATTLIDSGVMEWFIEFATTVVGGLTSIVELLGAVPTLISAIAASVSLVKGIKGKSNGIFGYDNGFTVFGQSTSAIRAGAEESRHIKSLIAQYDGLDNAILSTNKTYNEYIKTLNGAAPTWRGFKKYAKETGNEVQGLGIKARAASFGVSALNIAFNALVGVGIGLVISAIISGITSLIHAAENARKELMEAGDAAMESATEVFELANSYIALCNSVDAGTASSEEFLSLRDDLIEKLGLEGATIQSLTEDYNGLRDAVLNAAIAELETDIAVGASGASAAKTQAVKDVFGGTGFGNRTVQIGGTEDAEAAARYLMSRGFSGVQLNYRDQYDTSSMYLRNPGEQADPYDAEFAGGVINLPNAFDVGDFDALAENYEYLKDAMTTLSETYSVDNPLRKAITEMYNKYDAAMKEATEHINNVNMSVVQKEFLESIRDGETPESLEEFEAYRNKLINDVGGNLNFDYSGTIDPETLVDNLLGENEAFAKWLNDSKNNKVTAEKIAQNRKAIANVLSRSGSDGEQMVAFGESDTDIDNFINSLSDGELEAAYDAVQDGARSWEDITEAVAKYNSEQEVARRKSERMKNSLNTLWSSSDFSDAKDELVELASTAGGVTADKVKELADESETLSEILMQDGMSAEYLANVLQTMAEGGDGLSLITENGLKLNSVLSKMETKFEEVTAAKARYDSAMEVDEKDTQFRSYAEAYAQLLEEIDAGTVNSNAFWASAEYLFGSDQLEAWGWGDGLSEIYAAVEQSKAIFGDADSAAAGFVKRLYEMSSAGQLVDEETGKALASAVVNANGSFYLDIDDDNIDKLAKKMGIAEESVVACIEALSMWGDMNFFDTGEVLEALADMDLLTETEAGVVINTVAMERELRGIGKDGKYIYDLKNALTDLGNVTLLDAAGTVEELTDSLSELGVITANGDGILGVNIDSLVSMLQGLQFTAEEARTVVSKLATVGGMQLVDAQGNLRSVGEVLEYISGIDFYSMEDGLSGSFESLSESTTDSAVEELNNVESAGDRAAQAVGRVVNGMVALDGTSADVTITVHRQGAVSKGIDGLETFGSHALGTKNAPGGEALVGEEGPELVQSGRSAYLVGADGPEIVDLEKGSMVFPADETKRILRKGGKRILGSIPSYRLGNREVDDYPFVDITGVRGTARIDVAIDPTSAEASEVAFESLIERFVAAMNGITGSGTLGSGKSSESQEDATKNKLDEMKEAFSDTIGDFEHTIFLMEKEGVSSTEEFIAIYEQMQAKVLEQEEKYRKMGLDDTSDYIQELQKQWWEYSDSIKELRQDAFEDFLNDSKFSIEVLEHDGNDTSKILESWRAILSAINDEIAYYTGLGYDMTSDEIQSLVQEAWSAEEAMTEVLETLVSNAQDAIDGLQDVYETLKTAAEEYAQAGYVSLDTLQDIVDLGTEYMAYLRDENGQIVINEENIRKMVAAKTQQLAVESALNYVEQMRIAKDSQNEQELKRLLDGTLAATKATWGLVYANLALLDLDSDEYAKALHNINTLRAIADNTIANIGAAMSDGSGDRSDYYSDAQDALDTILDLTMDLIKHEKEQQVDALQEQIERYREIIDLKKESLQTTKDENDYNKEVANRIKEIADLQNRIDKLKLEGTRESLAQASSLEAELYEKQEELADYQADYSLEKQQDALDKEADAFEEAKNQEIAAVEETISSTEKLYQLAIARINANWTGLYQDLLNWNYEYGNNLQSEIVSAWGAASAAVKEYGSYLEAVSKIEAAQEGGGDYNVVGNTGNYGMNSAATGIVEAMKANSMAWLTASTDERSSIDSNQVGLASTLSEILGESVTRRNGSWYRADGSLLYSLTRDEIGSTIVGAMKANSALWKDSSAAERANLSEQNKMLAARLQNYLGEPVTIDNAGVWWLNGKKLYDVYHSGGFVGGSPTLKQNEVMAILEKGEAVLDQKKEEGLYKIVDFASVLSERLGKDINANALGSILSQGGNVMPTLATLPELGGTTNNDYSFNPVINVTVAHGDGMTGADAVRIGRAVAESTLAELSDAFNKRGITRIGSAALKQQ